MSKQADLQATPSISPDKYLIPPMPIEEADERTLKLPNLMTRHLSLTVTPQKHPDRLTEGDLELCITCLPFFDEKTGQGVTTIKDIEDAFLGIFGVAKNRKEIIDSFENIFNKYQEIKAKTYDDKGKIYTGHIKFRLLTGLGFLDKKEQEISKTREKERSKHKHIKKIYFKFDTHIVEALKSKLEGYTYTKLRFFKQHYKQLNSKQRKLILPLLAEKKDFKDVRQQDLNNIYSFGKYGIKPFKDDLQDLKDRGLLSDKSIMKPYKQYKNSYFAHLVKGSILTDVTTDQTRLPLNLQPTDTENLIGEKQLIENQKLIEKLKHLKEKRSFSLAEIVTKLNGCLKELIANKTVTNEEAKGFKIKDKGMLARRLAGERKFTDTEAKTVKKLLETY